MRKVSASTTAMPEAAQVRDVHPDGPSASGGQFAGSAVPGLGSSAKGWREPLQNAKGSKCN